MNPNQRKKMNSVGQARPGQDIVVAKKAANFPSVGMSLPGYQSAATGATRSSRSTAAPKHSRFKSTLHKVTLKRIVLSLLLIVVLTGGYVGFKLVYNAHKLFGGSILSVLSTTKLKGEDSGRVNILLAGNSSDDVGHQGADLTDSIMLVSIDTKNNTGFLLSIPRDLWVNIPGAGYQKINDAYVAGQNDNFSASGYPDGGMGQLEQIVARDFGVPIDYYALINYQGLKDAVNAVGGISINIQSTDPRGIYDPSRDYSTGGILAKYTNGVHTLNGEQALDLARARGDAYGSYGFSDADFDRTQHQRQMLLALKTKAVTVGVLANPARLTKLLDAAGNNITTDLKLSEVHRLYNITKKISNGNIKSLSLNSADGQDLLTDFTSDSGAEALVPAAGETNYSAIQSFVKRQTSTNPAVQEGANITVLNGTDTDGLAGTFQTKLNSEGLDVSAIGDSSAAPQATTTIIDASAGKDPATRAELIKQFGTNVTVTNPYSGVYSADFIIVLGEDQVSGAGSATTGSNTNN